MNRPYRLALFCGIAPQAAGVAIFLLWTVTRWHWLVGVGLITIWAGVFSVLIGAIALAVAAFDPAAPTTSPKRGRLALPVATVILLANFPVAAAVIAGVITIATAYGVTIHNASPEPLRDVHLVGGGCNVKFADEIPPGGTSKRTIWFRQDGEFDFEATINGERKREVVEGYVTNGQGGSAEITVEPGGAIKVRTFPPPSL
jgi:hypothetical protein